VKFGISLLREKHGFRISDSKSFKRIYCIQREYGRNYLPTIVVGFLSE
jgi:hypothetical protein